MHIYVAHATAFDYENELYAPLREALAEEHELIFPHQEKYVGKSTKELLHTSCDFLIAEVSHPSTGMGIELGWADVFGVPILALHHADATPSSALNILGCTIKVYQDGEQLKEVVQDYIKKIG